MYLHEQHLDKVKHKEQLEEFELNLNLSYFFYFVKKEKICWGKKMLTWKLLYLCAFNASALDWPRFLATNPVSKSNCSSCCRVPINWRKAVKDKKCWSAKRFWFFFKKKKKNEIVNKIHMINKKWKQHKFQKKKIQK